MKNLGKLKCRVCVDPQVHLWMPSHFARASAVVAMVSRAKAAIAGRSIGIPRIVDDGEIVPYPGADVNRCKNKQGGGADYKTTGVEGHWA